MSAREMRFLPDKALRQRAKKVSRIDDSIRRLIDDMIETLHRAKGVGLAAPQVGISLRVVVLHPPDGEIITLVNPEIVKILGEKEVNEACLSIPGYQGFIKRATSVTVKGRDREGKELRFKAEGLLAQALQHEIDHLNGVLYIDHLESEDDLEKVEPKSEASTEADSRGTAPAVFSEGDTQGATGGNKDSATGVG
jgi:peptide deformylase